MKLILIAILITGCSKGIAAIQNAKPSDLAHEPVPKFELLDIANNCDIKMADSPRLHFRVSWRTMNDSTFKSCKPDFIINESNPIKKNK